MTKFYRQWEQHVGRVRKLCTRCSSKQCLIKKLRTKREIDKDDMILAECNVR